MKFSKQQNMIQMNEQQYNLYTSSNYTYYDYIVLYIDTQ